MSTDDPGYRLARELREQALMMVPNPSWCHAKVNFARDPYFRRYPGLVAILRAGYRRDKRGLPIYRVRCGRRIV
jgi:hypothetical protein